MSGVVAATQSDRAADLPYAGTWRLNVAKSDFGETTVSYEQTASGHLRFTASGQSYNFQIDGKPYPSLFGYTSAWKQIDATTPGTPGIVELVPSGTDGLTISLPDDRERCEAKFDGKDYPVTGPIANPGMTLAIQKTSPRSFDMTGKQGGKPIVKISFTVSDDGKTLTLTGGAVGVSEKFAHVYDRH